MSDGSQQAFVPGYDYDVFISYAWVNNYPEQDDKPESGWVTRFKTKLQQRIDERLGRTGAARLFFDRARLGKNQDFDPQIEAAVQKSAVFVAMFSEGYIQSPGCREEIAAFNKAMGGSLAQSGRLFLVPIDYVDSQSWPAEFHDYLQRIIGYEFYVPDPVNQIPTRVRHDHSHFQVRLEELRTSLAKKLKQMKAEKPASPGASTTAATTVIPPRPTQDRPTVLVAQSTADLRKQRKSLITYCESAELTVLGAAPYPTAAEQFREAFLADLGQSHLFVQLLSDCYSDRTDEFPEGGDCGNSPRHARRASRSFNGETPRWTSTTSTTSRTASWSRTPMSELIRRRRFTRTWSSGRAARSMSARRPSNWAKNASPWSNSATRTSSRRGPWSTC